MSDQPTDQVVRDQAAKEDQARRKAAEDQVARDAEEKQAIIDQQAREARQAQGLGEAEPEIAVQRADEPIPVNGMPHADSPEARQAQDQFKPSAKWAPHPDDDSLKAKLYNGTRVPQPDGIGLVTTQDEDEQLANVDVSGPNNNHVTASFQNGMNVYMGEGYQEANGIRSKLDADRAASMMMDQAAREEWKVVRISGSNPLMKDAIWVHAQLNGLKTDGHDPSKSARQQLKALKAAGGYRKPAPFTNGYGNENKVEPEGVAEDVPGNDDGSQGPAAEADDPGPDTPPPPPPPGDDPDAGNGGGGNAAELPEDAPKPKAEEAQPPAKVGASTLSFAADEPASEMAEPKGLQDVSMDEEAANKFLDDMGRDLAQAKLDGKFDNQPELQGLHDHIFGEQTPETREAFTQALESQGFDTQATDIDRVADRMRTAANDMINEATGKTPDADVMQLPVAANDAQGTNVANLATGATGMVAHSDPAGTDAKTAQAAVERKPEIVDAAKGAVVPYQPKAPAANAAAPDAAKPPAAPATQALIADASGKLAAKRGAGAESTALARFEQQTGVDLNSGGKAGPNVAPQLPQRRA